MSKPSPTPKASSATLLDETCAYCDRVRWGNYQYLINGKWRHFECYPGSQSWCEWYENQPKRTDYGNELFRHTMHREPKKVGA